MFDIEYYKKAFIAYAEMFRNGSPGDLSNIDQKLKHSLDVLAIAEHIIACLNPDSACSRTALLAALFHDVGRFPQLSQYGTFLDKKSENHGLLGARTLRRTKLLEGVPEQEQKIITAAVLLHNRRSVPRYVSEKVREVTNIVRDADKLDILSFIVSHFQPGSDQDPVITLHLKPHPTAYTETIYEHVMAGRLGTYGEMQWVNDFKMTLCSWVYDFNFAATRRLCIERGYIDGLIKTLPETPEMQALAKKIMEALSRGAN